MSSSREPSLQARLARLGFADTEGSAIAVAAHPVLDHNIEIIRAAADPDLALRVLGQLIDTGAFDVSAWEESHWRNVSSLCGASTALGEHLVRHPLQVPYVANARSLRTRDEMATSLREAVSGLPWDEALIQLRIAYRKEVSAIAALDVAASSHSVDLLPAIAYALSDLADAVIATALELARLKVSGGDDVNLSVIAMGKCGARELNYVSDVDVIFVAEPANEVATELAKLVMNACSQITPEGMIWEVDAALRPEGKSGALVRTVESHLDYYQRWAQSWEYQALLKARLMAGDERIGAAFVDSVAPFVWEAAGREGFIESVQAMRERVTDLIPAKEADRELKLGRGGLRDVEFAVQLLQMVHGRSDDMVRSNNTLQALEQLAAWGYVGRDDASALTEAYRFLRTLEHRIQLTRMRRTHVLPTDEDELRRLGRSMGYLLDPVAELTKEWRKHAREVRRIHEKLFYRPLLEAVARLDSADARLTPDAARARLHALGYRDPEGALRHIEALTSGVSRRAVIQRTLLPVLLQWFAETPDPDAGLFGFRRVSEALGTTPWYLRLLRDESVTAERLAVLLGSSKYVTDLLLKAPEAVNILSDEATLRPRTRDELVTEALAIAGRYDDAASAVAALRSMRRRELFRISAAEVLGLVDVEQVGSGLTDVTDAVIGGAIAAIGSGIENLPPFVVIAMGRYGGGELGFGSDADVMFCFDDASDPDNAGAAAHKLANELRTLLMAPSTDPELVIDADLRPEGKNGPMVRSLESFTAYYQRWSVGWESQALLRAFLAAGNAELGQAFMNLIDPIRYHEEGLSEKALYEIRRLKARMESERLPRGVDPTLHTKLGPGGLSDVEWVAQIMQMQHGHEFPTLRTTRTLPVLRASVELKLMSASDARSLIDSWNLATRVRNTIMLVKGRSSDVLPKDPMELSRIAQSMGYGPRAGQQLMDDYLRTTRRARSVVMRLLYGQSS